MSKQQRRKAVRKAVSKGDILTPADPLPPAPVSAPAPTPAPESAPAPTPTPAPAPERTGWFQRMAKTFFSRF